MNTDIKKLVESLFNDDIDDILKGMTDDGVPVDENDIEDIKNKQVH